MLLKWKYFQGSLQCSLPLHRPAEDAPHLSNLQALFAMSILVAEKTIDSIPRLAVPINSLYSLHLPKRRPAVLPDFDALSINVNLANRSYVARNIRYRCVCPADSFNFVDAQITLQQILLIVVGERDKTDLLRRIVKHRLYERRHEVGPPRSVDTHYTMVCSL